MEAKKRKKSLSFEVAMEKLDGIVKTLENGNIPLEKLVETYREGLMYQKICQEHLDRATLTLETLKAEGFDSDESCSA
ncbi:MAG: exodeoxyribonuclease VII small subunit [bacterium]